MLVTKCYLLLCINYSVKLYVHALCYYYVVISILTLISDTGIQNGFQRTSPSNPIVVCTLLYGRKIHTL